MSDNMDISGLHNCAKDYRQQHAGSRLPLSLCASRLHFCITINVPDHCKPIIIVLIESVRVLGEWFENHCADKTEKKH